MYENVWILIELVLRFCLVGLCMYKVWLLLVSNLSFFKICGVVFKMGLCYFLIIYLGGGVL